MWKSSDKKIAKISSKGIVTGVGSGTATITGTVGSGSNNQKFTCKVTVKSRISTENTNIICLLDEYQEVLINLKKPKDNEYLVFETYENDIINAEWDENSENYIIRIIPENVGKTTLTVYTQTIKNFYDDVLNKDDILLINITVLSDPIWISDSELDSFGMSVIHYDGNSIIFSKHDDNDNDSIIESYSIDIGNIELIENEIYETDGIKFKVVDGQLYFNIESLKELNLIQ
jgi:hypothetical protein